MTTLSWTTRAHACGGRALDASLSAKANNGLSFCTLAETGSSLLGGARGALAALDARGTLGAEGAA